MIAMHEKILFKNLTAHIYKFTSCYNLIQTIAV